MSFFWDDIQRKAREEAKEKRGPSEKVSPAISFRPRPPLPTTSWTPPTSFPSLKGHKRISLDLETCDPDLEEKGPGVRRGAFIAGIGVGIEDVGCFYFPMRHEGGGNLDPTQVLRWAKDELSQYRGSIVGANLLYDLDFLAHEGITIDRDCRILDVQLAEPLIDENRSSFSLDSIAQTYLGTGKKEIILQQAADHFHYNVKAELWRLPAQYVGDYAEGDLELPLAIIDKQMAVLDSQELLPVFDMETRLIPLMLAMRRRGVRIDTKKVEELRPKLIEVRNKELAILRSFAGPKAEFMAPDSFVDALKERDVPLKKTPTGKISVTKDFLEAFQDDPMIGAIFRGRRVNTIINTFLDGHILGHLINGRIHCEFNQLRGERGGTLARFSSSNPNLQNIPVRDPELGPLIRGAFIPEEGEVWGKGDYSQVEYRLLTHFARGIGAAEAREKYRQDPKTDFHKMCAEFCGIDPEDKIKRRRVKNINFAKTYGAQKNTLAITMGCSLKEAEEFIALYEEKLPFTVTTFNEAQNVAGQRGYVLTLMKRRQRFPFWEPARYSPDSPRTQDKKAAIEKWGAVKRSGLHAALNYMLQGSAADIMKKAMVDILESGIIDVLGAPLLTVHDELDWSIPQTKEAEDAIKESLHIMENCFKLRVPLLVEFDRGRTWGECL